MLYDDIQEDKEKYEVLKRWTRGQKTLELEIARCLMDFESISSLYSFAEEINYEIPEEIILFEKEEYIRDFYEEHKKRIWEELFKNMVKWKFKEVNPEIYFEGWEESDASVKGIKNQTILVLNIFKEVAEKIVKNIEISTNIY